MTCSLDSSNTSQNGYSRATTSDEVSVTKLTDSQQAQKAMNTELKNPTKGVGRVCHYIRSVKPLAWVIVVGDGLHNLADGIALGAAISQGLGIGLSTGLAILFHEIPHELGDYVILLSTGMTWYVALIFNMLSSVGAIVGFFVGVTVGTDSESANGWILTITAGQFLYIALVDLLPELVHLKEQGCIRCGQFIVSVIGFGLGFAVLLCIAIYEEQLDSLIA